MSELAARDRVRKQSWAAPGSAHDVLMSALKLLLPALIGILLAYLAMAPLTRTQDISFILDKNKVALAKERMRVQAAQYRGQDAKGRAFRIAAQSAVQSTSRDPIVDIRGMSAEIQLDEGPATLHADRGRYNIETEKVAIVGPILFAASDGYRLETRDVVADLNQRTMQSRTKVEGRMPLGNFSANQLDADLNSREVTLTGNARLHIIQGALR
jgi:lipopolysaccharide export system protein LptC